MHMRQISVTSCLVLHIFGEVQEEVHSSTIPLKCFRFPCSELYFVMGSSGVSALWVVVYSYGDPVLPLNDHVVHIF